MSSDIRLEEDRVTVEGKLHVEDGANLQGDISLSRPSIYKGMKIQAPTAGGRPGLPPPPLDVVEIWAGIGQAYETGGISRSPSTTISIGGKNGDTPNTRNSTLLLRSQYRARLAVGSGDNKENYTQIENNVVTASDFVLHEIGSLIGKIRELEDRIRELEGES